MTFYALCLALLALGLAVIINPSAFRPHPPVRRLHGEKLKPWASIHEITEAEKEEYAEAA